MIDLHIHSIMSDGSDYPRVILDKLVSNNIKTFSITDHDNIAADIEIVKYGDFLKNNHMEFITGIEFSADYKGENMHVLAYGFDLNNQVIHDLVSEIHTLRLNRIRKRLEILKDEFSIVFSQEEIDWLYSLNNPGKPHIANLLIKHGYATEITPAIKKFMYHNLNSSKVDAIKLVDTLVKNNIIVGIAHPLGGEGDRRLNENDLIKNIEDMKNHGISFLECYYSMYTAEERESIKRVADKFNLLLSGGSDYHGTNKDVRLGDLGHDYTPNKDDLTLINKLEKGGYIFDTSKKYI